MYEFCLNCYKNNDNFYIPNAQVLVLPDVTQYCIDNSFATNFENQEFLKDLTKSSEIIAYRWSFFTIPQGDCLNSLTFSLHNSDGSAFTSTTHIWVGPDGKLKIDQSIGFSHTLIVKVLRAGSHELISNAFTVTVIDCSASFLNLDNKQIDS